MLCMMVWVCVVSGVSKVRCGNPSGCVAMV